MKLNKSKLGAAMTMMGHLGQVLATNGGTATFQYVSYTSV
jgi:hypothetical protein